MSLGPNSLDVGAVKLSVLSLQTSQAGEEKIRPTSSAHPLFRCQNGLAQTLRRQERFKKKMAAFSAWFWNERFWLPHNVTWADLADPAPGVEYPKAGHLLTALPLALGIFAVRILFERWVFTLTHVFLFIPKNFITKFGFREERFPPFSRGADDGLAQSQREDRCLQRKCSHFDLISLFLKDDRRPSLLLTTNCSVVF